MCLGHQGTSTASHKRIVTTEVTIPGVRNESSPATPQVLSHYVETQGKWKLRGVGKAGSKRSKNLRSDAFPQLPKLIYFAHRKNKSKLKIID